MSRTTLVTGSAGEYDRALNPTADLLASRRVLDAVAQNHDMGTIVRLYRPAPTVAFSGRETSLPGFAEAVSESIAFGFEPVIRPAGGRMVAVDENWLVLDVISPEVGRDIAHKDMFLRHGNTFVKMLSEWGIHANVGSVAGEYCPGDYSVNARNAVKIVGTAQRVTRGARLFSASIPFQISPGVAELFTRINSLLELEWDPQTLGSIHTEAPHVLFAELERAVVTHFAPQIDAESSLADLFDFDQSLYSVSR
jgi:lipoate-protein ligase A